MLRKLGPNDCTTFRTLRLPTNLAFGVFSRSDFMLSSSLNTPLQAQLEVPPSAVGGFFALDLSTSLTLDPRISTCPVGLCAPKDIYDLFLASAYLAPFDPSALPLWPYLWLPSRPFDLNMIQLVQIISLIRIGYLRFIFPFLFGLLLLVVTVFVVLI